MISNIAIGLEDWQQAPVDPARNLILLAEHSLSR